jgi:hypothetical protein
MVPYGFKNHWLQMTELEIVRVGESGAEKINHFAAVACSKRCAIAVLQAHLPLEDALREKEKKGRFEWPSSDNGNSEG